MISFIPRRAAAGPEASRWYRGGLLVGALATGLAILGLPGTAAAQTTDTPANPFTATATTVTLITGDQVTITNGPNGMPRYAFHPVTGAGNAFQSYQGPDGDHYVIPAIALPYVGRQLDRALFDVTALARDGITGSAHIPVNLSYASASAVTAPAGVTVTSVSGATATGYLTPTSGTAFAAALRGQLGADIAAGHQAGTAPLFGGVAGISLAANTPAPAAAPRYPMYVLQINATDLAGAPADNTTVIVINTDSARREVGFVPVNGGIGKIAVPAGNYSALASFPDFDAAGHLTAFRTVVIGDFTVAASGTSAVSVDERTATARVGAAPTPRPSTQFGLANAITRTDANNLAFTVGTIAFGNEVGVYAAPQAAVRVGGLHYQAQWDATATTASDNYRYDLAAGGNDIPANLTIPADPSTLATVHQYLYADPAGGPTGGFLAGPVDPATPGYSELGTGQAAPTVLTDYLGNGDGGTWATSYQTPNGVFLQADPKSYPAGRDAHVEWGHAPVAAGLGQYNSPQLCDACVAGSTLSLAIPMFRDSVPDHNGFLFGPAGVHFTLYRDGTKIFDQDNAFGAAVRNIPATPSTYLGVLDVDVSGQKTFSQGTKSHTEETVKYDPANPGPPLPADQCVGQTAGTPCAVLAPLTLDYHLATDLTNSSALPVQVLGLSVGHVEYGGVGSNSPITSASVSVSYDGGSTWQPVPVFGFAGRYVALWPNPASAQGTSPSLKVTATDAAGDAISQTVTNAYTIAQRSITEPAN